MPAHLEQNATSQSFLGWSQEPLTSSVTADGKPANRFELTPPAQRGTIAADLEGNVNGPSGVQSPPVYTLGDATPVVAPSGVQSPQRPQAPVERNVRSSLSDSYDALDTTREGDGPTVVALDAGEDSPPSGAKARSSIYLHYGTRESIDAPGPLPEISPRGVKRGPSGGQPLALASEESFGSAVSGWGPELRRFEDAKTVDEAGPVLDDDFLDCDFHEADESLPGSPASPASPPSEAQEPAPERAKLGGGGALRPAGAG